MQSDQSAPLTPPNGANETNVTIEQAPYRPPPNLLAFPYFSLRERDRRWGRVWRLLTRNLLDGLIVPPLPQPNRRCAPDARYLSHVGAIDVPITVLFTPHTVTAFVDDPDFWARAQPWCDDLRPAGDDLMDGLIGRLQELDPAPRRLGLVGLEATEPNSPSAGFVKALQQGCPGVTWTDPANALLRLRAYKSREELAFLRQSVSIAEQALGSVVRQPLGEVDNLAPALWQVACAVGSEPIAMPAVTAPRGSTSGTVRLHSQAAWGGYRAGRTDTVFIDPPDPQARNLLVAVSRAWEEACTAARPRTRFADMVTAARRSFAEQVPVRTPELRLEMHSAGLDADVPTLTSDHLDRDGGVSIQPGACFELVVIAGDAPWELAWGDTVVVGSNHTYRLGTHTMTPRLAVQSG
jgi:Xaa-Pro dipeptidase